MALNIYISLTVTVGWRASRFTKEREREREREKVSPMDGDIFTVGEM